MSLVLDTNINSLLAQNSLTSSGNELSTSLEQLSSGLRINTSADDAAGYAIVQGMTSQIGGLNQAAQNANDGVSLTQTASGALQEVTSDLQTMRNLAVQSLNATNSASDRADLDTQFQQLKADIDQVSQNTNFNGVNLLDGTFAGAAFQVGADAGQTITVGAVNSTATSAIGQNYTVGGTLGASYVSAGTAAGTAVTGTITVTTVAAGVTLSAVSLPITLGGVGSTASSDLAAVASAINSLSGTDGGVIATLGGTSAAPTGINLTNTSGGAVTVTVGGTLTAADAGLSVTSGTATTTTKSTTLSGANVLTVNGSNTALAQIDSALQTISTTGAELGAYQNRFQAAITGLNTTATNLTAARSTIQDTDYASATSDLSKAQILQQASTAMVAQANTIPQNVLTLLQKLP
jgi:flagellin